MKKVFNTCLIIISLIISVIPVSATEAAETVLLGDVTQDDVISIDDAVYSLRCASGLEYISDDTLMYTDLDFDGIVSTEDAREILRIAAGISEEQVLKFTDWVVTIEPTCTSEGKALSHSLQGNYTREKVLPKISHKMTEATCTTSGYCTECFDYFYPPKGHSETDWIIDQEISTSSAGRKHKECTVCKEVTETSIISTIICLGDKIIPFGSPVESLVNTLGNPTEILNASTSEYPIKYYVYAQDYSKLTVFTCSDDLGVIGVYSIDPTFKFIGTQTVSYDNVTEFYRLDNVYFKDFKDELNTGKIYAFYATTVRETIKGAIGDDNIRASEKLIFHTTNAMRAINNIAPLEYSIDVSEVARAHSLDMATNDYYAHDNLNSESPYDRLRKAGINFNVSGENISAGQYLTAYDFNDSWYNSSGHRDVMLSPKLEKLGVGVAINVLSTYGFYATQDYIR